MNNDKIKSKERKEDKSFDSATLSHIQKRFFALVALLGFIFLVVYLVIVIGREIRDPDLEKFPFTTTSDKQKKTTQKDTAKPPPKDIRKALAFEVIRIEKRNQEDLHYSYVEVSIKFTNLTDKPIKEAVVACVLKDASNRNVGAFEQTVVYSYDNNPLMPGESRFHNFKKYMHPLNMVRAVCNTEVIEWY